MYVSPALLNSGIKYPRYGTMKKEHGKGFEEST